VLGEEGGKFPPSDIFSLKRKGSNQMTTKIIKRTLKKDKKIVKKNKQKQYRVDNILAIYWAHVV
jgi:hypothetical protein